ncbi:hypothetical protein JCM8097_008239 [Rhodosporidiobolus ruineniae]
MPAMLPRRTAWATPGELHLVYSRLFLSEGDAALQLDGLSRIKVWMARGTCPHAVESTANLLELLLRDTAPSTSSSAPVSPAELRLSYSMAIIRFVNSLVDPLQTTYYARSIASLAAQIQLPLAFVELRHQATHEDLPALGVLREAAKQAVDWLYSHYWYPLLYPSSAQSLASSLPPLPLDTLRPLLASYKALVKSSLKDASVAPRLKNDLLKAYREIEKWVAENALGGKGTDGEKARERALRGVVEVLIGEAGGLVPLAKKKRPTPRSPALPSDLHALWSPLLRRLDETYSSPSTSSSSTSPTPFSDLVAERAVEMLCAAPSSASALESPSGLAEGGEPDVASNPAATDKSYALTLTVWVVQLVVVENGSTLDGAGWDDQTDAVVKACLLSGTPNALALVDALLRARSERLVQDGREVGGEAGSDLLAEKVKPLVQLLRGSGDSGFAAAVEADAAQGKVDEMERRWKEVEARLDAIPSTSASSTPPPPVASSATPSKPSDSLATPSWPRPVENWTPRPIGWLPGGRGGRVEALDLPALSPAV